MQIIVSICVLLLTGFFCGEGRAIPVKRPISEPLRNEDTYKTIQEVARQAQLQDTDESSSIRLLPRVQTEKNHTEICCLHANILDFYLHNVLRNHDNRHPKMHQLKADLARVSEDLQSHGCNVTHHHDNKAAVGFRKKLTKMGGERGINKAIGEIDILFTFLQDYCIHP